MANNFRPVTVTDRNGKPRTFYPTRERDPTSAAAMNRMLRKTYIDTFDVLGGMAWLAEFVRRSDENARCFVQELSKQCRMPLESAAEGTGLIVNIVTLAGPTPGVQINLPKEPVRLATPASLPHRVPEEGGGA
jgi:hypothetical protein